MKRLLLYLVLFGVIIGLAGCFGGGSSSSTSTITLSGSAYDEPIPNANVTIKAVLSNGSEQVLKTVTADSNGNWTVNLDPSQIPANSTLMVEVNGTLNGKNVVFHSVLGKDDTVKNIAEKNSGKVTPSQISDLITSNISTVDYLLACLKKGKTEMAKDPEAIISAIKAQDLDLRKKFAAAIKAYVDYNATLNSTTISNPDFKNLVKKLLEYAADGSLTSSEIKAVFNGTDYVDVIKAEKDLSQDPILRKVLTEGIQNLTPAELYQKLQDHDFFIKYNATTYAKMQVESNGSIDLTFYIYNSTSGNWEDIPQSAWNTYGLNSTPIAQLDRIEYNSTTGKLYVVFKTGQKYMMTLLGTTDAGYSMLLTYDTGSINWRDLLNATINGNQPMVYALGTTPYTNITAFRLNCTSTSFLTNPLRVFVLNGDTTAKSGNVTFINPFTGQTIFAGNWEYINNDTAIKIDLYGSDLMQLPSTMANIHPIIIIALYNATTMGSFTGNLTDFMNATNTVALQNGLPILYPMLDMIKFVLFTNETAVQSFMSEDMAMMSSETGGTLPQDVKEMLCDIGSANCTTNSALSVSMSCSDDTITLGFSNGTNYTVGSNGEVIDTSNNVVGHITEITPFSFAIMWNNGTSQEFVNATKKNDVVNNVITEF